MKYLLWILPLLAALTVALGLYLFLFPLATKAERWEDQIAAYESFDRTRQPPPDPILFIGSSSIQGWKTLASDFPRFNVINRGFGGAHMDHVRHYASRVIFPYAPTSIVVYVGDNDIEAGQNPAGVAMEYRQLVDDIHKALPNTHVYYLSMKPCRLHPWKWDEKQGANDAIAKLSEEDPRRHFVDISEPMLDAEGRGRRDVFRWDGEHLNGKGYELWASILRPLLERERSVVSE